MTDAQDDAFVLADRPLVADPAIMSPAPPLGREEVLGRQHERFGGFQFGAAFFGWVVASGIALLLVVVLGAIAVGVELLLRGGDAGAVRRSMRADADVAAIVTAIALAVIVFVAFWCGGYVASRMARFDGVRQGLAVWFWAVVIGIVAAILGAVLAAQPGVADRVRATGVPAGPTLPAGFDGTLTVVVAIVVALAIALGAAMLGGLGGMRFHRRVDRVGFERPEDQ